MKENNNKFISMMVWVCVTMFYCYQYILRVLPNIIMPEIIDKYAIGANEIGTFGSVYYVGYVAVHIPIGILLSRLGGRIVLPACIAISALGIMPIIYFDYWETVIVGRTLTGIGSSAAIVGAFQIFRMIFPDKFSRMLGIMVSFGLITIVYGGGPLTNIIQEFGIDMVLNILLYSGLILAAVTYFIMPKSLEEVSHSNIWGDIRAVLSNYKLLLASICAGLMVGPLEGFADVWSNLFITTVYNIDRVIANEITSSVYLGMCIGCVVLPYIAEKIKMHVGVTIFSSVAMILSFMHVLGQDANADTLYYACLIMGVFCAYQVVILSKITTFVSEERSGMAGSIGNMIVMFFGSIFHKVLGYTTEYYWAGEQAESGAKIYSSEALIKGMYAIPIASFIAIIGLFIIVFINYKHAQSIKNSK